MLGIVRLLGLSKAVRLPGPLLWRFLGDPKTNPMVFANVSAQGDSGQCNDWDYGINVARAPKTRGTNAPFLHHNT